MNPGEKLFLAPFLPLLEQGIAALLRLDPATMEAVGSMSGKVIAVDLLGLDMTLYVVPHWHGVHLLTRHEGEVHVRIRGTPLALLTMATAPETHRLTLSGEVEIIGDLVLSSHIQSILTSLNLDWEEWLSHYVGDIAAHQLGRMYRSLLRWLRQTQQTLELDVAEYLKTEINLLPDPEEVKRFVMAVDILRADADRLEARLKRLRRQLSVAL